MQCEFQTFNLYAHGRDIEYVSVMIGSLVLSTCSRVAAANKDLRITDWNANLLIAWSDVKLNQIPKSWKACCVLFSIEPFKTRHKLTLYLLLVKLCFKLSESEKGVDKIP